MSPQHDMVIANGTGSAVRSDINGALAALVANSSGSTEPATTYAYMLWADSTANVMKMRNGANSGWIELFELDGEFGSKTFNGNITLNAQGDLRLADSDSSNWVAFQAPATVASNVTWTLPSADGTANQTLITNGSGTLSWATPTSTSDIITEGNTSAEVVDTGSDGHFKVTTEGTERARIDSSGRLLVGTSSAPSADLSASLQIVGTSGAGGGRDGRIVLANTATTVDASTNSDLGIIKFFSYAGSVYEECARIACSADAGQGSGDKPSRLVFSTTASGASSPTERMRLDSSGNLKFNSGYGSVATAYGCRAWVNFNGTGTVAIRANGNVSSITDQGTGDYVVNITTAMPDANYATVATCENTSGNPEFLQVANSQTTSGVRIIIKYPGITNYDSALVAVAIFR